MKMLLLTCALLAVMPGLSHADDRDAGPGSRSTLASVLAELRLGLAAHDVDGLWSGQREEKGFDVHVEAVFRRPLVSFWSGVVRPNLGVSINNRGFTSQAYAGALWTRVSDSGWSLGLGLGLSVHDGKRETAREHRKQLGSRVLFRIPIELGYAVGERHRIALTFAHVSNAGLASENEGLDTLGLTYGYRF